MGVHEAFRVSIQALRIYNKTWKILSLQNTIDRYIYHTKGTPTNERVDEPGVEVYPAHSFPLPSLSLSETSGLLCAPVFAMCNFSTTRQRS